tara:strand:- start:1036 stop:1422 length:387 start_codon:yes stop_codon:yes gene_type:complete
MIITLGSSVEDTLIAIGDKLYSTTINITTTPAPITGNFNQYSSAPQYLGIIIGFGTSSGLSDNQIETDQNAIIPSIGDFLLVVKDGTAESSGVKGSFAVIEMAYRGGVSQYTRPELFTVGAEVIESSK